MAVLLCMLDVPEAAAQPVLSPNESSRAPYRFPDSIEVNLRVHLRELMRRDSLGWVAYLDSLENTPLARMRRNLEFDMALWQPTEGDSMRREQDIRRALDHDFLYPKIPRVPLFSISPSQVLMALGVTEDTSPWIKYTLMSTGPVTVKIYDLEAELVTVLVDRVQQPGKYSMKWNFKDANGLRVHYGDYIAEVIAGDEVLLQKRIIAP